MKGKLALTIVAALSIMLLIISCRKPIEVELPPHKISYLPEITITIDGEEQRGPGLSSPDFREDFSIIMLEDISRDAYPHLRLREGFVLHLTRDPTFGASSIYLLAIHEASESGFVVEHLNHVHGGFLFAPIESAAAALEYVELMYGQTMQSAYDRDLTFIHSLDDFETELGRMKEIASHPDEVKMLGTPPTYVSRATEQGPGKYLVELVYKQEFFLQTIDYHPLWVYRNGGIEDKLGRPFVEGVEYMIIIE